MLLRRMSAMIIVCLSVILLRNPALAETVKAGIYVLPEAHEGIEKSASRADFVIGFSIRALWKNVEPKEGQFDWSYIDSIITLARQKGKFVTLRILAGVYSPAWVVNDPSVPKIKFVSRDPNQKAYLNKQVSIPKIWNEAYLKKWYSFLEELAKRYADEPLIYWVAVSGPVLGSAVPTLPGNPETVAEIKKQGYTRERWIEVWKEAIDKTASAFPKKMISLALDPPPFDIKVAEDLASYAVGRYGKRICLQSNGLSAKVLKIRDARVEQYFKIFPRYADKATIGFQMTWAAAWKNRGRDRLGPLDQAIEAGMQLHASYLEIYQDDISDPANAAVLSDAARKLRGATASSRKAPAELHPEENERVDTQKSSGKKTRTDVKEILSGLGLTKDQEIRVREIIQKARRERGEEKGNFDRKEIVDKIREVLTDDQRKEFDRQLSL